MAESGGRKRRVLVAACMAIIVCVPAPGRDLRAQATRSRATEPERPRFEVASIKPHRPDDDVLFAYSYDESRFTATGSLHMLIRLAYELQDSQLAGGLNWTDSDLYDIVATADGAPTPDIMRLMLRELLADRFMLRLSVEMRERPIYALSMVKSDAIAGPQLKPAAVDCDALFATARPGRDAALPPTLAGGRPSCGIRFAPGTLTAGGMTMAVLANHLSMWVDRIVMDRTGLQGTFDLSLKWLPDRLPEAPAPLSTPDFGPLGVLDPSAPSIFTALQEQLGLKLDALKGPAEVFVVEQVERPTAD
jgi:uncharacterized protein (TIGR03435 family)